MGVEKKPKEFKQRHDYVFAGDIADVLQLLTALKFQNSMTAEAKNTGNNAEGAAVRPDACVIESHAEKVHESNRYASALDSKTLEGVRATERLRDALQQYQFSVRWVFVFRELKLP